MKVFMRSSASSVVYSHGGIFGIGAENFWPDTSRSITVPSGTSSSNSML